MEIQPQRTALSRFEFYQAMGSLSAVLFLVHLSWMMDVEWVRWVVFVVLIGLFAVFFVAALKEGFRRNGFPAK